MIISKHQVAIKQARIPYLASLSLSKAYTASIDVPIITVDDLTARDLSVKVALNPSSPVLTVIPVAVTSRITSWGELRDRCLPRHFFPCDVDYDAPLTVYTLAINYGSDNMNDLSGVVIETNSFNSLYFELVDSSGNTPVRIMAGDIALTEGL